MGVAVVGAGSLIAGALRAREETASWRFVGHVQALAGDGWLAGVDTVLNCAFDPRLKTGAYDIDFDVDLRLAQLLRDRPSVRYVMLSSRLAYGPADGGARLSEDQVARPTRPYGIAKLVTEQSLRQALGDRLTVLRLSNVFGDELLPARQNFFAIALRTLREHGRIVLDMSPFVERDFVPVQELAASLLRVVGAPRPGLFNLGAGHGTPTGRIAQWLIEGHGSGTLLVSDVREHDAFWLDIGAAREAFGIEPVAVERIRARCLSLGERLREQARGGS